MFKGFFKKKDEEYDQNASDLSHELHDMCVILANLSYNKMIDLDKTISEYIMYFDENNFKELSIVDVDQDLRDLRDKELISSKQQYDYREEFVTQMIDNINDEIKSKNMLLDLIIDQKSGNMKLQVLSTEIPHFITNISRGQIGSNDLALKKKIIDYYQLPKTMLVPLPDSVESVVKYISKDKTTQLIAMNPRLGNYDPTENFRPGLQASKLMDKNDLINSILNAKKLISIINSSTDNIINEFNKDIKSLGIVLNYIDNVLQNEFNQLWINFLERKGIDIEQIY